MTPQKLQLCLFENLSIINNLTTNHAKYHMKPIIISILSIITRANYLVGEGILEHLLNDELGVIGEPLIVKNGSPMTRFKTPGDYRKYLHILLMWG